MKLISQRTTIMPQVSTFTGASPQCPSQVSSPLLVAETSLTLLVTESA